jgi:hypothetical protein
MPSTDPAKVRATKAASARRRRAAGRGETENQKRREARAAKRPAPVTEADFEREAAQAGRSKVSIKDSTGVRAITAGVIRREDVRALDDAGHLGSKVLADPAVVAANRAGKEMVEVFVLGRYRDDPHEEARWFRYLVQTTSIPRSLLELEAFLVSRRERGRTVFLEVAQQERAKVARIEVKLTPGWWQDERRQRAAQIMSDLTTERWDVRYVAWTLRRGPCDPDELLQRCSKFQGSIERLSAALDRLERIGLLQPGPTDISLVIR